ncbi:MAG: hypothetical protein LLF96_12900 [Eubacteriales bacterium]|nr:hypothetical protein [Eubacteriales bacterium]
MQIRHHYAQGTPQDAQRRPPASMPEQVPLKKPAYRKPPARDSLPPQKPITDEPAPKKHAVWKIVVKRFFQVLGLLLALVMVYVFLLMGEPDENDQLATQSTAQEETIRVPIAAGEVTGTADLGLLAANFGKPVLALYVANLPLQKATLFDTAFRGGYARRLTLNYTFSDGMVLTMESIRPTAAVSLLADDRYRLNVDSLYTVAGLDAVRMESDVQVCLIARGSEAVYAVLCPMAHAEELSALLKLTSLMEPSTP